MKLHTKSKLLSLHDKMSIFDEKDEVVYTVESKMLSIHDKTYVYNQKDEEIAYISKKAISLHQTHFVEMADGFQFEMRNELFHLIQDVIEIEELGWKLKGNVMEHDYEILDSEDQLIATVHNKWLSIHHVAYIDILDDSKADMVVALYVALEHIIQDRAVGRSAGESGDNN